MKKTLLIALLITFAMGTAVARQHHGSGPAAGGNGAPVERLAEQLDLDLDQVAAITAIFEDSRLLRDEERERSHEILCEIRTNTHVQILEVLTPEQQVQFEKLQKKRREIRQAFEDAHAEHGFGSGRKMRDCDN